MATPRTWLLASPHAGDNSQLFALANALGWPYETKRLVYHQSESLLRFVGRATLAALNKEKSDAIAPPFPDLILAAGRATEAVAGWIRRHGNRRARIVFIGAPWNELDRFDLVIATPQYAIAPRDNVLRNPLPFHGVHPASLAAAAKAWLPRLAHRPHPWFAVLVGGSSGPYIFGPAAAGRLGRQVSDMARKAGGTLLVSTSARTGRDAGQALSAALSASHYFHEWTPGAADNPYLAFLALAERIVVTADSVSMISEACATGKPVLLFDIEEGKQAMRAEEGAFQSGEILPAPYWRGQTLSTTAFRLAMRFGPPRWSRDLRIVHRNVVNAGLASWLGDAPAPLRQVQSSVELERAVARVQGLFGL